MPKGLDLESHLWLYLHVCLVILYLLLKHNLNGDVRGFKVTPVLLPNLAGHVVDILLNDVNESLMLESDSCA